MIRDSRWMCFYLTRCLYFGMGISLLINCSGTSSILSFIIGSIIGYYIISYLGKFKYNINNYFRWIIIILFVSFLINNFLVTFSVLTSNFYLTNTPSFIILLFLFIVVCYGYKRNINTIFRVSKIFSYVFLFIFIILSCYLICNIKMDNYYPIIISLKSFIISILYSTLFSVCPVTLLFFIIPDYDIKEIKMGYIWGVLSILFMLISIIGILGVTLSKLYRYPEYVLFKKINIFNFIEKQENFLAFIWFIDIIISLLLCSNYLNKLVNKYIYLVLLFLFSYFIFISNYTNILYLYHYSYIILSCYLGYLFIIKRR